MKTVTAAFVLHTSLVGDRGHTTKVKSLYPSVGRQVKGSPYSIRDVKARGLCGLEAKSFGLGLTVSGLGLDLGLMASGLIEIGLVASNIYSAHDIN